MMQDLGRKFVRSMNRRYRRTGSPQQIERAQR